MEGYGVGVDDVFFEGVGHAAGIPKVTGALLRIVWMKVSRFPDLCSRGTRPYLP